MCRASPVGVVTAPLTARFLLSPPSHLPPNLLPTPRPPPRRLIRPGRPLRLRSRPRPSPAWPVRPQRWAGGWAAAAAAAAAEAARSTIVFLTLCAPTLRLFPFLPTPPSPPPTPTAGRARPTRLAPRRPPAARSSGGLGAFATAARLEAPPTWCSRTRGVVLQVGSSLLLLGALRPGGASVRISAREDDGEVPWL